MVNDIAVEKIVGHGWSGSQILYLVQMQPSVLTHRQLFHGCIGTGQRPLFDGCRVREYCLQKVEEGDTLYAVEWHEMWVTESDIEGFSAMVHRYWGWNVMFAGSIVIHDVGALLKKRDAREASRPSS